MGFYRGPNIVTDGLVLALDPGSARSYDGTTAWNDLSSAKSVYTLNNGVTYQSINGGVFDFDGVDDYASTSSAPLSAGATAYSIEAVFKADSTGTQVIWEQGSTAQIAGKRVCMILLSTGTGGFNGQNADFQTSVNYSINTWYNWLITVDTSLSSNKIKIYVNGVLSAQGNPAATLNAGVATTAPILIGEIIAKSSTSITVNASPGGSTVPTVGQFIMFIKNAVAESHGARGYYLEFKLENNSTSPVELFAVGSSVMKSYP